MHISKTPAAGQRRTHKQLLLAICGYRVSTFTFPRLSRQRAHGENNCNVFCRELYLLGKTNAATNAEVHKMSLLVWVHLRGQEIIKNATDKAYQIMPIIGQKPLQFIVLCCFFWILEGAGASWRQLRKSNPNKLQKLISASPFQDAILGNVLQKSDS